MNINLEKSNLEKILGQSLTDNEFQKCLSQSQIINLPLGKLWQDEDCLPGL